MINTLCDTIQARHSQHWVTLHFQEVKVDGRIHSEDVHESPPIALTDYRDFILCERQRLDGMPIRNLNNTRMRVRQNTSKPGYLDVYYDDDLVKIQLRSMSRNAWREFLKSESKALGLPMERILS